MSNLAEKIRDAEGEGASIANNNGPSTELLKGISPEVIKLARSTMAHLLLKDNAKVVINHCANGVLAYVIATLNPSLNITAIDSNLKEIEVAKGEYKAPNLQFKCGSIRDDIVPEASVDAVINSYALHDVYFESGRNQSEVIQTIQAELKTLKNGGSLFIESHLAVSDDEFVLAELPDNAQNAQLLKDYAEEAGSKDKKLKGFYLEEMPPRFPKTKLFKLSAKWLREFILHTDNLINWDVDRHKEYSFFKYHDFTNLFKQLGARVTYAAPQWDQRIVQARNKNKIRVFDENGTPRPTPETSFAFVVQKLENKSSLTIQEHKPSDNGNNTLNIIAFRNDLNREIQDVVSRGLNSTEIIPYRITSNGQLNIFVHKDIPRALTNTVKRNSSNIDGKHWSGHMVEAFAVPKHAYSKLDEENVRETMRFTENYLGLKTKIGSLFENGPILYPAPDYIDEHVETKFIEVKSSNQKIIPQKVLDGIDGFSAKGTLQEINSQQILDALNAGFIASGRLDVQILALYKSLDLHFEQQATVNLNLKTSKDIQPNSLDVPLNSDNRLKETKGTAGQITSTQSVFVDEGKDQGKSIGLASRHVDFAVKEELSENTAVILSVVKNNNNEIMIGVSEQYSVAPQNHEGNGYILSAPKLSLPIEVDTLDKAQRFVATKLNTPTDIVNKLGESFFSHLGVTPERVYPFIVNADIRAFETNIKYVLLKDLYAKIQKGGDYSFIKAVTLISQATSFNEIDSHHG